MTKIPDTVSEGANTQTNNNKPSLDKYRTNKVGGVGSG